MCNWLQWQNWISWASLHLYKASLSANQTTRTLHLYWVLQIYETKLFSRGFSYFLTILVHSFVADFRCHFWGVLTVHTRILIWEDAWRWFKFGNSLSGFKSLEKYKNKNNYILWGFTSTIKKWFWNWNMFFSLSFLFGFPSLSEKFEGSWMQQRELGCSSGVGL